MVSRRTQIQPARMLCGALMLGLMLFGPALSSPTLSVAAQTVSSYQPVISSGNYITSSSPLPNGGRVQAVYYASGERNVSVSPNPNRPAFQNSTGSLNNTVPAAFSPQTEVRRMPSVQAAAPPLNSGFQSVYSSGSNIQVVTATTAQSPATSSPNGVYGTSGSSTTLNRVPTLPQIGNVPAASTQPTLPGNAMPQTTMPQTTMPQTTLPQGTVTQGTITQGTITQGNPAIQKQGQLNWQPISGQPGAPVYVYPTNQVTAGYNPCNPQQAVVYQPVAQAAKPVKNYKPLIPLRKHVPRETYVAQGMFGQPKAYVAGQGVRNFFRYILP